jgi:hypothetical protein
MNHRRALAALALAAAFSAPAHAVDVAITGNGAWHPFSVAPELAPIASPLSWIDDSGTPLRFTFVVGAGMTGNLTVVDLAIAGDTFRIFNLGAFFADTSSVPVGSYESSHDVGLDYAAALADDSFSRGVYTLVAGSYGIVGSLLQSVTLGGEPLFATAGALSLTTLPVPEPETYALLAAGLLTVGALSRRRRHDA